MSDVMSYAYQLEWSESETEPMREWLASTWKELDGNEPEQDFVEYIMVMIKTQKTMQEIQSELCELEVEEGKAKEFSSSIGAKLQEIEASAAQKAPAAKSESKVVSVVSSKTEKKSLGPLKTSRAGEPQSLHAGNSSQGAQKAGTSRLLQSALQSNRGGNAGPNTGRGFQGQPQHQQQQQQGNRGNFEQDRFAGQKRGGYDNNGYDNNKKVRDQGGFNDNRDRRVVSSGPMGQQGGQFGNSAPPAASAAPANDTVQYFEQMNKVAQASGFRNAQEMIASQKEMMAMMHGAMPMPMSAPPVPVPFAAPYSMQAPFPGGPPPPPGYPPQQGYNGFQGRGGRGFARGGYPFEGGRHWEGGRGRGGRGRGGRGPAEGTEGATVPAPEGSAPVPVPVEAAAPATETPAATAPGAEGFHPAGRGYQGRGYQGRGRGRGEWQAQAYDPSGGYGRFGRGYGRGGGGRFYAGAGAPDASGQAAGGAPGPVGHKTWVRSADLDSALVTGRKTT